MALDKFDVCLSIIDSAQKVTTVSTACFINSDTGFNTFLQWIQKHCKLCLPVIFLTEATGIYHEQLAWYLFEKNKHVVVILPNKAKKYKEALGLKSKTDTIDASGLGRLACEQHLKQWQPLSKNIYKMRMLTRQAEAAAQQLTVNKNQLHALKYGRIRMKEVEKMLTQQLALLEQQKQKLENMIEALVDSDTLLKKKFNDILSIKVLAYLAWLPLLQRVMGLRCAKMQNRLPAMQVMM